MLRSAGISRCKAYRYWLRRRWGDGPEVVFIGLNPSTADDKTDDPTLRRIMGFSHKWGFSGVTVINLFAWRSQNPRELRKVEDPVGPRNNYWLKKLSHGTEPVVAAWGNGGGFRGRNQFALATVAQLYCFGKTGQGHPRHPLYAPVNSPIIELDKSAN